MKSAFQQYAELVRAKCSDCGRSDIQLLIKPPYDPCNPRSPWICGACLRDVDAHETEG